MRNPDRWQSSAWAGLALLALVPLVLDGSYYVFVATLAVVTAIAAIGLNVLSGLGGLVSLGHAGFFAIGAYVAGLLAVETRFGLEVALPVSLVAGALVGSALGFACSRLAGPFLAVVTIAFGIIIEQILIEWDSVTRGFGGIVGIGRARVGPIVLTPPVYYGVVLGLCVLTLIAWRNLARSPWGRAIVAARERESATGSVGLNPMGLRVAVFASSGAIVSGAGALYPAATGFVNPESFGFQASLMLLLAVVFGGPGRLLGPVVGALLLAVLPEFLHGFEDYRLIIYGLLLLGTIYFLPGGVVGAVADRLRLAESKRAVPEPGNPPARSPELPSSAAQRLCVSDVSLRFGGLRVLDGISIDVEPGRIHGLIGANGAGKTSLLNVLSGFYVPQQGVIRVADDVISSSAPYAFARKGIARTFQTTQLFDALTATENVMVGLAGADLGGFLGTLLGRFSVRRRETSMHAAARSILGYVGYPNSGDEPAAELPFGHRRLVELARALACRPAVLLLDEPAAGLAQDEVAALASLLRTLKEAGTGVLLVEHNMDFLMDVSNVVTVLDRGRCIAHGLPQDVRQDPMVLKAYLGEYES